MTPARRAALAMLLALAVACTYAWPTGSPADAGPRDGGEDVLARDTGADGPESPDAGGDADAEISDAPADVAADACTALAADLQTKKIAAETCTVPYGLAGDCTKPVADECGCIQWMFHAIADATTEYHDAVDAFNAKCKATCTAQCPDASFAGYCLWSADAGAVLCHP